jgi:YHS domain-containing protein
MIKFHILLITVMMVTWSFTASAQKDYVYSNSKGAIKGYDPVAYFEESKPVKGAEDITYEWKGATWHFASESNRDMFKADPEAYAPQFGGYCAYAVSQGATAKIEPEAWKIVDGKLYLNYDLDIKKKWEANQASYIEKAEANWPSVLE